MTDVKNTCPTCDDPCPCCSPTDPAEATITFPGKGSCEYCECDSKRGTAKITPID